jgi:selenocysteine lyase/cysteine desulfurase
MATDDPSTQLRRQMPVADHWAFFNHAATSPIPNGARRAIIDYADEAAREGGMAWGRWNQRQHEVRALAAKLINANADEIAIVRSTTEGINLVAEGLDWRAGDNIVTLADEFPSNVYPWMNQQFRGVEYRRVPVDGGRVDLNRLDAACDSRTRIITLSWVGYVSGWRIDVDAVAEIAHRHGALFFLDAIQALGVFPLDVSKSAVDFLAADGHKWMLGPEGAGIFYIRRQHLDRLRPVGVGWNSVAHAFDYSRIELNYRRTAERYEGGAQTHAAATGFGASLELLLGYGPQALGERILAVTDHAVERLESLEARFYTVRDNRRHCSGIVTFELPGIDSETARRHCMQHRVALSCRSGMLRISPHAYNDESDLDRLIDALRTLRQ